MNFIPGSLLKMTISYEKKSQPILKIHLNSHKTNSSFKQEQHLDQPVSPHPRRPILFLSTLLGVLFSVERYQTTRNDLQHTLLRNAQKPTKTRGIKDGGRSLQMAIEDTMLCL